MNGRTWTEPEMRRLRCLYPHTCTEDIARALGRPLFGVKSKADDLGLRKPARCRKWTARELRLLRRRYAETPATEIASMLDRKVHEIYYQASALKLRKGKAFKSRFMQQQIAKNGPLYGNRWTPDQIARLRAQYPDRPTSILAQESGHPLSSVYQMARKLGLTKSAAYLASSAACRLRRGDHVGKAFWFPKGHVPANKGLRRPGYAPGRMRETQFRKGQMAGAAQKKWVPIDTEVLDNEGYLKRKVSDDRTKPSRFNWRYVHVLLWEGVYGSVPPGYAVKFIDGDRRNVVLSNLCLVNRADLARLNVMWNRYPRALCEVIQLRGALNRRINRRKQNEKPSRRPA